MYHHHWLTIGRAGFNIMHVERAALIIIKRDEMRREIIIGQIVETMGRGLAYFHGLYFIAHEHKVNKMALMLSIIRLGVCWVA